MSLWALIPAAASLATTALSKPRKKDYVPKLKYIDRYIANLKGRKASREVYHMAMQPYLRQIGRQAVQTRRQIESDVNKNRVAGSGIEAQMKLSANQQILDAINAAHTQALDKQMAYNQSLDQTIQQAQLQKGALREQGRMAYKNALNQWKNSLLSQGIGIGASALSGYLQNLEQTKKTFNTARAAGLIPETIEKSDFLKQAREQGYKGDLQNYLASLQYEKQQKNLLDTFNYLGDPTKTYTPEEISQITQENPELAKNIFQIQYQRDINLWNKIQSQFTPDQIQKVYESMNIPDSSGNLSEDIKTGKVTIPQIYAQISQNFAAPSKDNIIQQFLLLKEKNPDPEQLKQVAQNYLKNPDFDYSTYQKMNNIIDDLENQTESTKKSFILQDFIRLSQGDNPNPEAMKGMMASYINRPDFDPDIYKEMNTEYKNAIKKIADKEKIKQETFEKITQFNDAATDFISGIKNITFDNPSIEPTLSSEIEDIISNTIQNGYLSPDDKIKLDGLVDQLTKQVDFSNMPGTLQDNNMITLFQSGKPEWKKRQELSDYLKKHIDRMLKYNSIDDVIANLLANEE